MSRLPRRPHPLRSGILKGSWLSRSTSRTKGRLELDRRYAELPQ